MPAPAPWQAVLDRRISVGGLFGGGLRSTTPDGWTVDVVSPDRPRRHVFLSTDGGAVGLLG
ncbi:hypothetical protein [Streptomyces sp. NPDC058326]|uniref:hypothetical protein n=1 Tax=Streptomyces sp. NPDC058326 TaxID=3346447 RepID=UPI0036F16F08